MIFDQCDVLRVKNGANLTIKDATLKSCNPFWKGIRVQSTGSDVSITNARIENAEVGIDALSPNTFSVSESDFIQDIYSISLRGYDNTNTDATIDDNYFEKTNGDVSFCSSNPLPDNYYRPNVHKVIHIAEPQQGSKAKGIKIRNNDFKLTEDNYTIIQMFRVKKIRLNDMKVLNIWNSQDHEGVYLEDGSNVVMTNLDYELTGLGLDGVVAKNSQNIGISNSGINPENGPGPADDQTGILLDNVSDAEVKRNALSSFEEGIAYFNNGSAKTSVFRKNNVSNNRFAIVVAPEEHPLNNNSNANTATNLINLDIECNKLWNNEVGILGSGNLKDQGSSRNNKNTPAGNNFDDPNNTTPGVSRNTEWDILWQDRNNSNGFDYYYYYSQNNHYYKPNENTSTNNLNYKSYTMNGVSQHPCGAITCSGSAPDPDYTYPAPANKKQPDVTGCYRQWKRNPTSGIEKAQKEQSNFVKVYPNPFDQKIQVSFQKPVQGMIEVTNLQGQQITKTPVTGASHTFRTADWKPGAYFIKLIPEKGNVRTRKLLKVQ